jgi:hypothetical protein
LFRDGCSQSCDDEVFRRRRVTARGPALSLWCTQASVAVIAASPPTPPPCSHGRSLVDAVVFPQVYETSASGGYVSVDDAATRNVSRLLRPPSLNCCVVSCRVLWVAWPDTCALLAHCGSHRYGGRGTPLQGRPVPSWSVCRSEGQASPFLRSHNLLFCMPLLILLCDSTARRASYARTDAGGRAVGRHGLQRRRR